MRAVGRPMYPSPMTSTILYYFFKILTRSAAGPVFLTRQLESMLSIVGVVRCSPFIPESVGI